MPWIGSGKNWPVLDDGPVLERSQTLLASFLEDLKRSSFRQPVIKEEGCVDQRTDGLNFSPSTGPAKPRA